VFEESVIVDTEFANVKVTVNTSVLRHQPVLLTDVTNTKIWPGANLVLDAVDVEIWREIFHSPSWNTHISPTLGASEKKLSLHSKDECFLKQMDFDKKLSIIILNNTMSD
jgi:hypothetical protein